MQGTLLPTTMDPHKLVIPQALVGLNPHTPPSVQAVGMVNVLQAVRDEAGCRYLQDILNVCDPAVVDIIFREIIASHAAAEVMSSKFGNYFVQKLLEVGTHTQLLAMIHELAPSFAALAANPRGTYAIRRLVDVVTTPLQADLITRCVLTNPIPMFTDTNASQVCRRLMKKFGQFPPGEASRLLLPMLHVVAMHVLPLSTDQQGCCIVQRCFDAADDDQKDLLATAVIASIDTLVVDPFGNYVVQHVIDMNVETLTVRVISALLPNLTKLAMNKYSSNVLEKCLAQAPSDVVELFVMDLCSSGNLETLLADEFGNYVVQRALKASTGVAASMLMDTIKPLVAMISAEHVRRKIEARLREARKSNADARVLSEMTRSMTPNKCGPSARSLQVTALLSLRDLPPFMTICGV